MLVLDEHYKVTLDSSGQNYQLEKLTEIKDRETEQLKSEFKIIGYHGLSLISALTQYKNNKIADGIDFDTLGISKLLETLKQLDTYIRSIKVVAND